LTERTAAGVATSTSVGDPEGATVESLPAACCCCFDTESDAPDGLWLVLPDKPYMMTAKQTTPSAERARIFGALRSAFACNGTACWIAIFDPQ
jgi:hypothetical protein